jgi:hypothetical protein
MCDDCFTLGEMHHSKNLLIGENNFHWPWIACLLEYRNLKGTFLFETLKLKGFNRLNRNLRFLNSKAIIYSE